MAINYPTSLDTLTNPTSGQGLNSPSHAAQHSNANDAIEALEAKVGANSSAVTTSHDYKLGEVTGSDKAVGKTATQTLTNKTLTSPTVNLGSDATGDMYYRNSGGALTRLPIGTSGQILNTDGTGIPAWVANPAVSDASTTVKGVVEKATSAEIIAGTSAGGTGALLFVGPDAVAESGANKILKLNSSGALPAVSGANLTNIANPITYKNGTTTYDVSTANGTQTIAHGLGKTPTRIKLTVLRGMGTSGVEVANLSYNGTTASAVGRSYINGADRVYNGTTIVVGYTTNETQYTTGTVTFDSTNISIAWVKTNSPTGTVYILWEAEA